MNCFELPNISFCLIDYRQIVLKAEQHIIEDLHRYDLLHSLNMRKTDTKKALYHHIIHGICEAVMNVNTKNKIIIYNNFSNISMELFKYSSRTQVINFINTLTRNVRSILPVKIYDNDEDYDIFVDRCKGSTAELRTRSNMINEFLKKQQNKRFDFENAKKFASKFELTYLSEQYFNNIKVKNLVFL